METTLAMFVAVLTEKDGGTREKCFKTGRKARKYLNATHDSITAFSLFRLGENGERTFIRSGNIKPRTERQRQQLDDYRFMSAHCGEPPTDPDELKRWKNLRNRRKHKKAKARKKLAKQQSAIVPNRPTKW